MFRNVSLSRCPVLFAALGMVLGLASSVVEAQVKPFKIRGVGISCPLPIPGGDPPSPPSPHMIEGNATHLGRHEGAGSVQTDSAIQTGDGRIIGEFGSGSPFVFVGANGDELACEYGRPQFGAEMPGTYELTILDMTPDGDLLVEAYFIAEFVVQPELCTGKYQGATGSWIMEAWSKPFKLGLVGEGESFEYAWEGEGEITFQKKKDE